MKSITSVQIFIGVWVLLVLAAGAYNMLSRDTDKITAPPNPVVAVDTVDTPLESCVPMPAIVGSKTVVLRVDDVQAFAWPSTTRMMVTDAEARNIPLALGIIPKKFGEDVELIRFLKERDCRLEFALHGFDHQSHGENDEIAEFEDLSKEDATHRLEHGLQELALVSDEPVRTWIPPLNRHSSGTQEALQDLGVTRFSTEGTAKWDYDAATFSYDVNALTPTDKVLADCEASFEESDVCIIMMHPQDFTTDNWHDAAKYDAHYLDLIDRLYGKGYSFGTFESVAS